MDLRGADAAVRLRELRGRFGDGCVDFTGEPDPEALALCSEPLMEEVLANGAPAPDTLAAAIARRQVFPCFFGAALRLEGLDRLLEALQALTRMPPVWPEFGARVFKISQDDAGTRLTWLKVTGGTLPVKAVLPGGEESRCPAAVQRQQVPAGERRCSRHGGGGGGPRPHPARAGPGRRGRCRSPAAGAGAQLPGRLPRAPIPTPC